MATFLPSHLEVVAPGAHPSRVALVAHGIMGSASNWRGFFRKLVEEARPDTPAVADFRWLLVDLRHHGRNAATPPPPDTVSACAHDLIALTDHLGVTPEVTIGHSFGGKVVLAHSMAAPRPPGRVVVLDSSFGVEPPTSTRAVGDDVFRVIDALKGQAIPVVSREALVESLTAKGFSLGLARWMTTNLEGSATDGYRFRFDLDGIGRLIADYFEVDAWPILKELGSRGLVVRGTRSDRVSQDDVVRLHTLGVPLVELDAGHWVHVDAPEALRRILAEAVTSL